MKLAALAALSIAIPIAGVAALPLFTPPANGHSPAPFHGDAVCNPYRTLDGDWFRANFHAHSWRVEGKQSPCGVIAAYHRLGFAVAQVSDHALLTDTSSCNDGYIPTYEHGVNASEVHFTAIGAARALVDRYPFHQGLAQKQETIDRLRADGAFVVINHPCFHHAFTPEDMARLDRYQAIEVDTRFCRDAVAWDEALTAGHAAWCFAGDDNHDASRPGTGSRFLYVDAPSTGPADVLEALRSGRFVCGTRLDYNTDEIVPAPRSVEVRGDRVHVSLQVPATVRWIGAGGRVLREEAGVREDEMALGAEPYLRIEASTPSEKVYLQPVRRCGG